MRAPTCAVPTFIKSAQFGQEIETPRNLVYSQRPHFHVRDSSSIKIEGDLWTASARGWGWAVESRSSQTSGGGWSPGEQGAEEERGGNGISTMGGKQDRNSERQAFVVCYFRIIQSKKRTQQQPPPPPPPPPPHKEIRTVPGLQTSFFFLSFVRSLAVSVFFVVLFFPFCPSLF